MALQLTAVLDPSVGSEELDCYTVDLEGNESIDFWFPKGETPTSMDIFVEFEREASK